MTSPTEREFVVYNRGEVRELVLAFWREGLRTKVNPTTGELFTEDVIRLVTQEGSRFYVEADGLDLALMGDQKRAEWFVNQIAIDRASSAFLRNRHAPEWGEQFLLGAGGVGEVLATGTPGTNWVGSTTVPDELASFAVDSAGNRYQVLVTGVADADGEAVLTMGGIDVGFATNLEAGAVLRWSNPPAGSTPQATVDSDFGGGFPAESDSDFVDRLMSRIRNKPAAGNAAQFRAWAREATVAVEDAFVYPAALNAGSVVVAVTEKRGLTSGPDARIASAAVVAAVRTRIVPPGSPVVPPHVRVLVVAPTPEPADIVVLASMLKGSLLGWQDASPFPESRGALDTVAITTLTSQVNFRITAGSAGQLPNGAAGPLSGVSLMVWNDTSSRFEALNVNTVEDLGAGVYRVLLNAAPLKTLALGDLVSPLTARRTQFAVGAEGYFDSLGPGEVIDLDASPMGVTAFRRPPPQEERPFRAGQSIINYIQEAVGSALADSTLDFISQQTPTLPVDVVDGPGMMVLGKLQILPLD